MFIRSWVLGLAMVLPASALAETYKLVTLEYPPYEYTEDGKIKGLAVEIVRRAFKLMKHEVIIESYPWARSQRMFENGDVDGIFTFFRTPEREQFALFGREAVITQTISMWVLKSSNTEFNGDLTKLDGHTFGVVNKTSYGERFDTAVKYGLLRTEVANSIESCIGKLLAGRTDIWVSNRHGAIHELRRLGKLDAVKELKQPLQEVPAFVGFSKKRNHTALRDAFDQALATLKQSGVYETLLEAYAQ